MFNVPSLRKVADDQKTHKNPALRAQGPVPAPASKTEHKGPVPAKAAPAATNKPARCVLEGKKWVVEYQRSNKNLVISETSMKEVVYIFNCIDCTIQVKGKVNSVTLDSCKKTAVVFDDVLAALEFVNCESVQAQVMGSVPTVSIDKTDGCMVYLSNNSKNAEIVTAKSSAMNILIPDSKGDFTEHPIPEQFKTKWNGKKLVTEVNDINL